MQSPGLGSSLAKDGGVTQQGMAGKQATGLYSGPCEEQEAGKRLAEEAKAKVTEGKSHHSSLASFFASPVLWPLTPGVPESSVPSMQ